MKKAVTTFVTAFFVVETVSSGILGKPDFLYDNEQNDQS